jgi:class 3 adenylate cyclase/CHASE2 domain-containing sensor protein
MNARTQSLLIALLLGAAASAIALVLLLVKRDDVPLFHRVIDLQTHFAALNADTQLGFGVPWYDQNDNKTDKIVVIPIDEVTFGSKVPELHQYPLPRHIYGTMLKKLAAAGAKAVAIDINFIEPAANPAEDQGFVAGLKSIPTILAFPINTTSTGQLGIEVPSPTLLPYAKGIGYSSVDFPGNVLIGQAMEIKTGAAGEYKNRTFLSLAAAGAELATGNKIDLSTLPTDGDGRFLLVVPKVSVLQVTTEHGQQVNEHTPDFIANPLSFSDAYQESISDLRQSVSGALVYIGNTAQAQADFVHTARSAEFPGLFANARLADQLMRHIYLTEAPLWLEIGLIVLFPLLIALAFNFMKTTFAIAISLVSTVVYAYVNAWLFVVKLYWLDVVHVAIAMVAATLFVGLYRVLYEAGQRRMVTNLFGMHVSPAIVTDILSHEDPRNALALKGKKVKATIFYSDIRGFTAMSETMTPEDIYAQLNEYFEEMCAIIFAYGGYVDKFIGDCVMAVFSAPYQTPDDAENAVRAAVAQQKKILELAEKWKAQGRREFTVGMGINTGDVVMGNLGASSRMNYTVIGDNVNLAARLYNVAKAGEIIISDYTYQEVKDIVVGEELEPVTVKGKKEPIRIYNIVDVKESAPATIGAVSTQPATA